jgi:hypothetical protein
MVEAFNDHSHVIVSPNAKDTLQLKKANGKKVSVPKVMTQVGLKTIFSDIVNDNPTIKNKVVERAFCCIISGLGSVHHFTDSHKQMCGCTECVGLHTLYCLLQANCGVMHCQFAIDAQHCTRVAQPVEWARGWATVALHPKLPMAIMEGTCAQWRLHTMLHWECQMLQCGDCNKYPILKEEAQEDAAVEDISFPTYKYKVSLCKDSKECSWLELVQKHTKIDKFHCLYYWPALGRGWYYSTSYMLAACSWRERQTITHSSVSSHHSYGKRMLLSFNKEIQSGYYQNTFVSIEGALPEWVDVAGVKHTCYFGHWSDNSKQDATTTK